MPSQPERSAIDHVAQRLSRQFTNLDTDLVNRVVWDTYRHFDAHATRDIVPIIPTCAVSTGGDFKKNGHAKRVGVACGSTDPLRFTNP